MKNTPLLFLFLALAAFSSVTVASEARAASADACRSVFTLPNNQWRQISLPCVPPAGQASVADVFGDDIAEAFSQATPSYGSNWIVYQYATSGYQSLSETDSLKVGVGYWIIQKSNGEAKLDLPATSMVAPSVQSNACPSAQGCFEITLDTNANVTGWNMVGYPGHYDPKLGNMRISTSSSDCSNGCDLGTAQRDGLVHGQFWSYNGSGYTVASNPGGELDPWQGYWAATLPSADGKAPRLLIPKTSDSGSINTLPKSPDYTYRIPTTTELVVGGHNELSALNKNVWKSTGRNSVGYAYHGSGSEKFSLYILAGADKSQMYQEIPTKPGRVYRVKATSYKPTQNDTETNFYQGADVYFTIESGLPSAEKANVLGESSSLHVETGYKNHTFEFTATGDKAYIVARSDQDNLAIHVSSASVKEKDAVVPFKYLSEIKHEGVTIPFANIKQWRAKINETAYSGFINDSTIPKDMDAFVAGSDRLPTKRELNSTTDSNILDLWAGETKTAVFWAVRGLIEENTDYFDQAVEAIDRWAQVFGGITGFGAGTNASWYVKEYANAMEIILHNDLGYEYPAEEKARAEQFLDTLYSVMLRKNGTEMLENGRLGGNWVSSQIMAKLAYWIVKHSLANTDDARKTATDTFNFISRFTDSLFVSQVYLNSDPLGVPNTFYANGLDEVHGRMTVDRIHAGELKGEKPKLNGIWYIGVDSTCFQHDGLVEEYYRDIGHAHMGMEPVYNIAQILYLQGGENMFERHKERLIKASEVLQETHLAALKRTNSATGTPYTFLPSPECNSGAEVRMVEYKDRNSEKYNEWYEKNSKTGALYSSQIYGYAKNHWSNWEELLPVTRATLTTEREIEPWKTGVPAVYLEAMFLWE